MVQSGVKRQYNLMTCKLLVGAHLILLNINLVLWTLISAYRLYLVFNSGKANRIKITCMDLDLETFGSINKYNMSLICWLQFKLPSRIEIYNSQLDNQISNK